MGGVSGEVSVWEVVIGVCSVNATATTEIDTEEVVGSVRGV